MAQRSNKAITASSCLDVEKIMEDFQKAEEASSSHRNGTFKIGKPFDEALDTILRLTLPIGPYRGYSDSELRKVHGNF